MTVSGNIVDRPIPRHPLGSTGEMVSLLAVEGWSIGNPSDPRIEIRIIRTAIDSGGNFLDNAWCCPVYLCNSNGTVLAWNRSID